MQVPTTIPVESLVGGAEIVLRVVQENSIWRDVVMAASGIAGVLIGDLLLPAVRRRRQQVSTAKLLRADMFWNIYMMSHIAASQLVKPDFKTSYLRRVLETPDMLANTALRARLADSLEIAIQTAETRGSLDRAAREGDAGRVRSLGFILSDLESRGLNTFAECVEAIDKQFRLKGLPTLDRWLTEEVPKLVASAVSREKQVLDKIGSLSAVETQADQLSPDLRKTSPETSAVQAELSDGTKKASGAPAQPKPKEQVQGLRCECGAVMLIFEDPERGTATPVHAKLELDRITICCTKCGRKYRAV